MASQLVRARRLLRKYLLAWRTRDPSALKEVFSLKAKYYVSPVKQPLEGLGQIEEYWEKKVLRQSEIDVVVDDAVFRSGEFIFTWRATFVIRSQHQRITLHGVMFWTIRNDRVSRLVEFYHKEAASVGGYD